MMGGPISWMQPLFRCRPHLSPSSLARAAALGLSTRAMLDRNEAYRLFAALCDIVVPGPPLTNVNDFWAFVVL